MPAFSNKALQIPQAEIDDAKSLFCYTDKAKSSLGDVFLCSLARSTLRGYSFIMRKYKSHCELNGIRMFPPSDQLWNAIMTYYPSTSREMMVRAKSAWMLYAKINEVEFPGFVATYFEGIKRIRVPVKKPSKPCPLVPTDQFMVAIMSLSRAAVSTKDHLVIISLLTSSFAGFRSLLSSHIYFIFTAISHYRLGDSVRLLKCSFVELPEMSDHVGHASTFISHAHAGRWGD